MEGNIRSCIKGDIYLCQLFGFTQRGLMDFVYNKISKVAGDALVEINSQISNDEEMSKHINQQTQQDGFGRIRDAFSSKLDLNMDRLEMFSRNNILRIPENVVPPCDKIQESCRYTKEDEEELDRQISETMDKIQASCIASIEHKKELLMLERLQEMADTSLQNMKEYSFDEEHLTRVCDDAVTLIETLSAADDAGSSNLNTEGDGKTITPHKKKPKDS
ncbi:uncharacterized protein LOC135684725 [Rhopilema esculentum]|uniref:uncharacterized protein LOC135684725 n=1 Tax=Rhopilema esculentum TaxID=499914 RepID=UPI0031E10B39|eukprot:gene16712-8162_t